MELVAAHIVVLSSVGVGESVVCVVYLLKLLRTSGALG